MLPSNQSPSDAASSCTILPEQPVKATPNTLVANIVLRLDLEPCPGGKGIYCPPGWEVDDMGIRRVMGDSVVLPNGRVLVVNGAQVGEHRLPRSCMHTACRAFVLFGCGGCSLSRCREESPGMPELFQRPSTRPTQPSKAERTTQTQCPWNMTPTPLSASGSR